MNILDSYVEQLIRIYGGTKVEWLELTKNNLTEALKCFKLLIKENSRKSKNAIHT
jgi:hypothetical protein